MSSPEPQFNLSLPEKSIYEELAQLRVLYKHCKEERSAQAAKQTVLEDYLNAYREERPLLCRMIQHLYEHLRGEEVTTPCDHIHDKIREYVW